MRMRRKKHGAERIAACAELLIETPSVDTAPAAYFPTPAPVHLEIGCGKGAFAVGMAKKYPNVNFIAMERVSDVACLALEKAMREKEDGRDNLRFVIGDARDLAALFPVHSFDCIYLNFSDPWPKKGYAKRRLTYRTFLELYRALLVPHGVLKFKTDNEGLYRFSLEEFNAAGLSVEWKTEDLHAEATAVNNVMTEYEKAFSEKGQPIYSAHVRF